MANVKITGLPALTTPATADLLEIVDDVAGTPTSKKITIADLLKSPGPIGGTAPGTGAFTTLTASSFINGAYATVASHATTSAIWAAAGNVINFTGTETITDFPAAAQAGSQRFLICAGAVIFTHAGNITVQGAATYTASAGDVVLVTAITTTTFKINILPQDGIAIKTEVSEDTTPQLGGDLDGQGNYAVDLQNFPDMLSNGPGYWFDGVDDKIDLTDSDIIDGAVELTFISLIRSPTIGATTQTFFSKQYSAAGFSFRIIATTGLLSFQINNGASTVTVTSTARYDDDKPHVVIATWDGSNITLYADGNNIGTGVLSGGAFPNTSDRIAVGCQLSSASDVQLHFKGEIYSAGIFNLALTAAEVKAFSNGAAIPYKYIGASQTAKLDDDCADDDTADWTKDGSATLTFDTDHYELANTAANNGILQAAPLFTIPGKLYRISLDIKDGTAASKGVYIDFRDIGTASAWATTTQTTTASWVTHTFTGTAEDVDGGLKIYVNSDLAGANVEIRNISVTQIGQVLDLSPEGITPSQWLDNSGNNLIGTVSGAIPTNLPVDHRAKYIDLAVTGNTSFTLPQGYKITSIIVHNTTANALTGGLDVGLTTNGVEIVSAEAIGANAEVVCTLVQSGTIGGTFTTADDTIYFSDGDDDANWNSASLEITVSMERISL